MMGAAVATVIGQVITALLSVWYLCHTKTVTLTKSDFKLKASIIKRTLILGVCSFLSQISLVAAMAAINNMIRKYGTMDEIFGQTRYAQILIAEALVGAVALIIVEFFPMQLIGICLRQQGSFHLLAGYG